MISNSEQTQNTSNFIKTMRTPLKTLKTKVEAPGKAIIVGEHAVIYGASAIAMPIRSVKMSVDISVNDLALAPYSDNTGVVIKATIGGRQVSEHLKGVIEEAFRLLEVEPFSLELDGQSSVIIGAGLGSSATLCIIVLRAIANICGLKLSAEQLAHYGNQLERHFHGNPSGLDTAVVALDQIILFKKGQGIKAITPKNISFINASFENLAHRWPFALIDSGTRSSTIAMVRGVAPFFQGTMGRRRVDLFDRLSGQVESGLVEGCIETVGAAMDECCSLLREAGASSQGLEEIIESCQKIGVISAKPTGAGGGGCVLALLDPKQAERQLAQLKNQFGSGRIIFVDL